MENAAVHPVVLNFADKRVEKAFIQEYDSDNRIFFPDWHLSVVLRVVHFLFRHLFFSPRNLVARALAVLIIVLLVPFIIVVSLSFFKKHSTLTHHITAFCNFAAGCVCIYVAHFFKQRRNIPLRRRGLYKFFLLLYPAHTL